MQRVKLPNRFRAYVPLIISLGLLVLLMPRTGKFNYDYRKGAPWMYETLTAQFDFPVLKTEAQLREELQRVESEVTPCYVRSAKVSSDVLSKLSGMDFTGCESFGRAALRAVSELYSRGILPDSQHVSEIIYVQKDRHASKCLASDLRSLSSARSYLRERLSEGEFASVADSLIGVYGIADILEPDLLYDQATTDQIQEAASANISPTCGMFRAGAQIVERGEMVTAELAQILDSYKAEYETTMGYSGSPAARWAGIVLLSLILVFAFFMTVLYTNPAIFEDYNRYCYLTLVFLLASAVSFVMVQASPANLMLVPYSLFALYLLSFFRKSVVLPVYTLCLVPLLLFAPAGIELFLMYFTAGIVATLSFARFSRGWQQFLTAFFVFIGLVAVYLTFGLLDGGGFAPDYKVVLKLLLGSFLSVAGYPLIFLFEKLFSLVSNTRLAELADTNNRLLRELATKAPGTFQHSLQVMNMCDEVARAVDANVLLVRTGALYHDIGKIQNPLCFVENAAAGNGYHEGLSPEESAHDIIRHVSDGEALAARAKLPSIVTALISTHHGTTCTAYFLDKFLRAGGDPDRVPEFRYPGPRPTSKEQVILMLCDSVEAASRSLKDHSPESISALVERIFSSKEEEGQFADADISIRELNTVKDVLKDYLSRVYHARIAYPKNRHRAARLGN